MTRSSTTGDVGARETPPADTHREREPGPTPTPTPGKTPGKTPPPHAWWRQAGWRATVPAALLAAFGVLLALVLTRPNFATHFDTSVRDAVERTAHMPQDRRHWMVFKAFAAFGNADIAIPGMAVFAGLMAFGRRSWRPVLAALFAYAVLGGAVVGLKIAVGRPGPVPGPLDGGFGYFPSGHTADTMMCYGTCALILAGGIGAVGGGRTWRTVIGAAMAALALMVGFSLVWLDYHWVTDVLGSYTLCGAALFGVAWILGMFRPRTAAVPDRPEVPEAGAAHVE